MKAEELYKELLELTDKLGIKVKRDKNAKTSGICTVDDELVLVVNTKLPMDRRNVVIARELKKADITNTFVKPALREFIDKQEVVGEEFTLKIDYEEDEEEEN